MTTTTAAPAAAQDDIARGVRFAFGRNWQRYLRQLDERRIAAATASLQEMLGQTSLKDKRFLDIGSGSGLFSLAAHRLGATVRSFDYDRDSVAATTWTRDTFAAGTDRWAVEHGSVLDERFLDGLGTFPVVYSWGVLHHTGAMWRAVELAARRVAPDGQFFIALYHDQGWESRAWWWVKRAYCAAPPGLRELVFALAFARLWGPTTVKDLLRGRPFHTWRTYASNGVRGMDPWRDAVDWIGGFPFEVATREVVVARVEALGFRLERLTSIGEGLGCNEFVFRRTGAPKPTG